MLESNVAQRRRHRVSTKLELVHAEVSYLVAVRIEKPPCHHWH